MFLLMDSFLSVICFACQIDLAQFWEFCDFHECLMIVVRVLAQLSCWSRRNLSTPPAFHDEFYATSCHAHFFNLL